MESNSFRKLLLIFTAILAVPVVNALYGMIPAIITSIIALFAIIIILIYFTTRTGTKPKKRGICADIRSINIKVNGRSYIISEGDYFNTEDHEQPGVMSYVEDGVWNICDSPVETTKGAIAEITIPRGLSLDALDISVYSGNLLINSATAARTSVNVYNDFAEIKNLNTSSLFASSGKGRLIIDTSLNGNAILSCGSGTLDIALHSKMSDFNIEAATGVGCVMLNGETFIDSTSRSKTVDNGAQSTIKATCGLGQLAINFTEVSDDDEN